MPFQSEAQRRYLWANEPEIARDWTDTYGSKIQAADGGITGLYGGGSPEDLYLQYLTRRKNQGSEYSPSRSEYESYVNRPIQMGQAMPEGGLDEIRRQRAEQGPALFAVPAADGGIMRLAHGGRTGFYVGGSHHAGSTTDTGGTTGQDNSADRGGNVHQNIAQKAFNAAHTTARGTLTDPEEKRDHFTQAWSGPQTFFGGGYRGLKQPGVTAGDNPYQSKLGGLLQRGLGIFGGLPGTIMGMLSNINPTLQGWRENLTGYKTQQEWEDARDERIAKQRIGNILATQQKYGTLSDTLQNRLAGLRQQIGYTGNDAVPSGNYITRKNKGILQAMPSSKFTPTWGATKGIEDLVETNELDDIGTHYADLNKMQRKGLDFKRGHVLGDLMSPQDAWRSIQTFDDAESPSTLEEVKSYYGIV